MIYQFDIPIYNTNALMLVEPTKEEFDELLSDEFNRNRFTDAELQKLLFNVKNIPNKHWGNERMAFMLVKLNSLENVVDRV